MFEVNNKDTRTTPYFTPCSSVFIVNFEHVTLNRLAVFLLIFDFELVFVYEQP